MALFRTRSAAVFGIDAQPIEVEVDLYPGGSQRDFVVVGMPDLAVRERRQLVFDNGEVFALSNACRTRRENNPAVSHKLAFKVWRASA